MAVGAPIAYALLFALGSTVLLVMSKQARDIFMRAGFFVYAQLLATLVSFGFYCVYGVRIARKPKACLWPLVLPPILVGVVAAPGLTPRAALVKSSMCNFDPIDPSLICRVYAEGFSETLGLLIVGGVLSSILFITASTIAAARTPSCSRQRPIGVHVPTLAVGLGTLLAVVAANKFLSRAAPVPPFITLASFFGVTSVAIATPKVSERSADSSEEATTTSALMLVTLLATLGVLVACISQRSYWRSLLFAVAGGESVDPSQRTQLLSEVARGLTSTPFWAVLYGTPMLLAASIPLSMQRRYLGKGLKSNWLALLSVLLLGLFAMGLPQWQSGLAQRTLEGFCPGYYETLLVAPAHH